MKLFIFGLGYSAGAIAKELAPECEWIAATSRSEDKLSEMEAQGIRPFLFDGLKPNPDLTPVLKEATHILLSIAPTAMGDPAFHCHGENIAHSPNLEWLGYLSTVGVYGDHDGEWVSEQTEPRPVSKRSLQRVAAEIGWTDFAAKLKKPLGIYRLAGIYGPGRNQMIKIDAGTARAIDKPGQVFNRIHVDDIALAVSMAARQKHAGILNVCDDEPAPPQEVLAYCAEVMGKPPLEEIPFEHADMTPMGRSFYGENKRCDNKALHKLIGGDMRYPTYREAFTEMWNKQNWRG